MVNDVVPGTLARLHRVWSHVITTEQQSDKKGALVVVGWMSPGDLCFVLYVNNDDAMVMWQGNFGWLKRSDMRSAQDHVGEAS